MKEAAIERALPHSLHIRLTEREPVAIWQHKGNLVLIDDEGTAIHSGRNMLVHVAAP